VVFHVVFTPHSERHLQDLRNYIALHSGMQRAENYVGRIVDSCLALDVFPERGMRRDDIRAGMRILGFERSATIAFSIEGSAVVIHGVYYGGQDFERSLRDEG
jgi:toxin ParE1/3/4